MESYKHLAPMWSKEPRRKRCGVLVCCWFLFNQRGQAPLPDLFYFLIQVPFNVCATENRTSQEEGLALALTDCCVNPLQHTNTPLPPKELTLLHA